MPVSKKQQACVARYNAKAYDRIGLVVKKGEKEKLQAIAAEQGQSLNSFITTAIEEHIDRLKFSET